ncbi:MAG: LysM peptidoglycan-binding domain-containing protein [Lentisphaeria bacterium]|nr:LysM peptidoglycan-binding domain-containing protein [Lentisphaeria bacterium]
MMIAKKMLMLSVAAGCVMFFAACETAKDVPVPDDAQAKEWAEPIQAAYPEWQPTQDVPKGNAEYEAVFAAAPKAAAPEQVAPVPAEDPVVAAEKEQYPILYAPCPDKVRLDVAENGDYLVDGSALPAGIVEKYLKNIVAAHKEKSTAIIYTGNGNAPMDRVEALLDICRNAGIANVSLVAPKKAEAAKPVVIKPAPAKKAVKMVVDDSKPGTVYVVKKGDSLGKIAQKTYGRASLAYLIYKHNKGVVKNIDKIAPGMKITLPALKEAE